MSWQEELRQRLVERNAEESAYAGIIEQSQQARLLSERNSKLLQAVGSVQSQPGTAASGSAPVQDNPVRVAYVASLESQITSLRDELAAVYKTQGQNAQRLLSMNETLREKEEQTRLNLEELRQIKDEAERLRRAAKDHNEQIAEKNRALQTLIDDAQTYQLEISQVEARNEELKKDNAGLLQRWLDHMNDAANKMNHANNFYTELRTHGWQSQPGSTATSELDDDIVDVNGDQLSASGKEERNGAPSNQLNMLQLNPNGVGIGIGENGRAALAWYEARRAVAERDALLAESRTKGADGEDEPASLGGTGWSVVDPCDAEPTDTISNHEGADDWDHCSPVPE
ncbi:autophagy-related protein 16 [Ceratobasidium sp. AG-Ba]|nr:autophagy-related protein 16 [Ceratobasidium sp. AG-Ba]QRW05634.1 autophagy-related protein 16 [Ceratobasidium sp. AG-Ba]